MSTTLLQNTQRVRGFQHQKFEYSKEILIWTIRQKEFHCPKCGSVKVRAEHIRTREIQGLPFGSLLVYFKVNVQIEDISAAISPNSKGAVSYGTNRRRGGTVGVFKEITQDDGKS